MVSPLSLTQGLHVVHFFAKTTPLSESHLYISAAEKFLEQEGTQLVHVSMLGHKADIALMALAPDVWSLRVLQTDMQTAGFDIVDSYVSITEISEYADGLPEGMKQARLYPVLPPEGKNAWCFYPMSKRRTIEKNWYTTPYEERKALMHEHGNSGKAFRGRIIQLITGSTGLDEYEWGVTLFGRQIDDLKDAVYTMRFDEASADFADFGSFYTGQVASAEEVLDSVGVVS